MSFVPSKVKARSYRGCLRRCVKSELGVSCDCLVGWVWLVSFAWVWAEFGSSTTRMLGNLK